MGTKSIIGYILALAGIVGLAIAYIPGAKKFIALPQQVTAIGDTTMMIISGILIVIGIFFIIQRGGRTKSPEVPIYHGKHIVGYRRS